MTRGVKVGVPSVFFFVLLVPVTAWLLRRL